WRRARPWNSPQRTRRYKDTPAPPKEFRAGLSLARHRLENRADDRGRILARERGLLLARAAADINAEHAEARAEIGHQQARQIGEAVDARIVTDPQRMQHRDRERRTFEQRQFERIE